MAAATTGGRVKAGDPAPDFTLPDQSGQLVRLRDLLNRRTIVLYFYPKDNTGGCTAEACAFRDRYEDFREAGAEVIGVSSDSVASHQRFSARHQLSFLLLSYADAQVRRRYGVPATLGLLPGRMTYVIDRGGVVRHVFSAQFNAKAHIPEALKVIQALEAEVSS